MPPKSNTSNVRNKQDKANNNNATEEKKKNNSSTSQQQQQHVVNIAPSSSKSPLTSDGGDDSSSSRPSSTSLSSHALPPQKASSSPPEKSQNIATKQATASSATGVSQQQQQQQQATVMRNRLTHLAQYFPSPPLTAPNVSKRLFYTPLPHLNILDFSIALHKSCAAVATVAIASQAAGGKGKQTAKSGGGVGGGGLSSNKDNMTTGALAGTMAPSLCARALLSHLCPSQFPSLPHSADGAMAGHAYWDWRLSSALSSLTEEEKGTDDGDASSGGGATSLTSAAAVSVSALADCVRRTYLQPCQQPSSAANGASSSSSSSSPFALPCPDPCRPMLNSSNACFLNATLQALVHLPPLATFVVGMWSNAAMAAAAVESGEAKSKGTAASGWGAGGAPSSSPPFLLHCLHLWMGQYYNSPPIAASSSAIAPNQSSSLLLSSSSIASSSSQAVRAPKFEGLFKRCSSSAAAAKQAGSSGGGVSVANFDLTGSTQEDASEFLQLLLETLAIEESEVMKRVVSAAAAAIVSPSSASPTSAATSAPSSSLLSSSAATTAKSSAVGAGGKSRNSASATETNGGGGGGGGGGKWVTVGARKGEERLVSANGTAAVGEGSVPFVGLNSFAAEEGVAAAVSGGCGVADAVNALLPPSLQALVSLLSQSPSPPSSSPSSSSSSSSLLTSFIFNGRLRSQVRRTASRGGGGGNNTVTSQPFFFLPISISSKPSLTIEEAIKATFREEVVDIYSDSSAAHPDYQIIRREYIGTLPNVLILQLKRWGTAREAAEGPANGSGSQQAIVKIDNTVSFGTTLAIPAEVLAATGDSSKRAVPLQERTYTLRAVVCHRGQQPVRGHYVMYVNNCSPQVVAAFQQQQQQQLHQSNSKKGGSAPPSPSSSSSPSLSYPLTLCDDSKLSLQPLSKAIADTPYMLFYVRNY